MSLRAATEAMNAKSVVVLAAIAVVGAAGVGGAVAGVGPTGGFDISFAQQQEPTPAPETAVHLQSGGATVHVGGTATYDVVVADADGGVGDHAYVVSVDDPSVASITDVSLQGDQSDETAEVSIADDGSSATVTAAPTDAADGGSVTVATVAVSGDAAGASDIGLRVDGLSTDTGDPYEVTAASGTSITVEPNPDPADFRVSRLNASHNTTQGETFTVSAAVTNDGDREATQTVRFKLDLDGNGTLDGDEVVASRAMTLAGHDSETVTFSDPNATDIDPGSNAYGVFTENDSATAIVDIEAAVEPAPAPETAVLLRPSSETIDAGETTTYDVVVAAADGGVGAQDFRVSVDDPTHATITDISVRGNPPDATTEVAIADDGSSVNVTAALTDIAADGSVTVATVTIDGDAVGTTDLGLRVDALGTETGIAYNVTAANGTSITIESSYGGGPENGNAEDESGDGPEFTRDEISQAKYGVDFADLSDETAREVRAIYNRQPFPEGTGPTDIDTRDEMSNDRYGTDFDDLSRETALDVQNDYDAQFEDGENE